MESEIVRISATHYRASFDAQWADFETHAEAVAWLHLQKHGVFYHDDWPPIDSRTPALDQRWVFDN